MENTLTKSDRFILRGAMKKSSNGILKEISTKAPSKLNSELEKLNMKYPNTIK